MGFSSMAVEGGFQPKWFFVHGRFSTENVALDLVWSEPKSKSMDRCVVSIFVSISIDLHKMIYKCDYSIYLILIVLSSAVMFLLFFCIVLTTKKVQNNEQPPHVFFPSSKN